MRRRRIRRPAPLRAWPPRRRGIPPAAVLALSALLAAGAVALFVPVDFASEVGATLSDTAAKWWRDGWRHVLEEGAGGLTDNESRPGAQWDLPRYWLGQGLPSPAGRGREVEAGIPGGVEARTLIARILDADVDDPRTVLARHLPSPGRSSSVSAPSPSGGGETAASPPPDPRPVPQQVTPPEARPVPEAGLAERERSSVTSGDDGVEEDGELVSFLQRGVAPENAWMAGIRRSVSWGDGPLVAIYHSHTSEMYRTDFFAPAHPDEYHRFNATDTGIVLVGEALAARLRGYGIGVVHSRRIHDWPVHALAYRRSRETVQQLIERYPTLRIILDVHRDSPEGLTAVVAGRPVGRVMIVIGSGEEGRVGPNPTWRENLALARGLEAIMNHRYPGLHRRTWVRRDARFNQDLHPGMLLLEIGSYDTHIDEALMAAQLVADAIAEWLWRQRAGSPD